MVRGVMEVSERPGLMPFFARRLGLCALVAALVVASWPVARARAAGSTYHVAASGSDGSDGSEGAPFRQVRRALQAAVPGDTILVADGSYLGFDVANVAGTEAFPLTIRATGSNAVVTPTSDRDDNRDTIFITYCSY